MNDVIDITQLPRFGEQRIQEARRAARSDRRAHGRRRRAAREGWVTLQEAIDLLRCNAGNVRRWANKAGIRRDRDHGFYDAAAVHAESERRRAARVKTRP